MFTKLTQFFSKKNKIQINPQAPKETWQDKLDFLNEGFSTLHDLRIALIEKLQHPFLNKRVYSYFLLVNNEGIPFSHFETDPEPIAQIKNLINALYLAENTLKKLSEVKDNSGRFHYKLIKMLGHYDLINDAYKAISLVTHLDIKKLFSEESKKIASLLSKIEPSVSYFKKELLNHLPNSHQIGLISGELIEQMNPENPLNFDFLTQLGAILPSRINQLSSYINGYNFELVHEIPNKIKPNILYLYIKDENTFEYAVKNINEIVTKEISRYDLGEDNFEAIQAAFKEKQTKKLSNPLLAALYRVTSIQGYRPVNYFSKQVAENTPNISQAQLNELQYHALRLLHEIESLKGKNIFIPVNILEIIHIINHTVTISKSIWFQLGYLGNSSQDAIRNLCAGLKYQLLAPLFGLVDTIENNSFMKPGTLSEPLITKANAYYNALIEFFSKTVDFSQRGQELVNIEDSKFINLRLQDTQKRIDKLHHKLFYINKEKEAATSFFQLLKDPAYAKMKINNLPQTIKQELLSLYMPLKDLIAQMDPELNQAIIIFLQEKSSPIGWVKTSINICHNVYSYLTDKFKKQNPTLLNNDDSLTSLIKKNEHLNQVSNILELESKLQIKLEQKEKTYEFYIQLNQDIIKYVTKESREYLFNNLNSNPFVIDEATILNETSSNSNLIFEKIDNHNLLTNKADLTCEQALTLYYHYDKCGLRLKRAECAYNEFIHRLNQFKQEGNDLAQINSHKKKLRELYQIVQPYIISALSTDSTIQTIDQEFKSFLSPSLQLPQSIEKKSNAPHSFISEFTNISDKKIKTIFLMRQIDWNNKKNEFLAIANHQFSLTTQQNLGILPVINERAHYVISHTRLSTTINDVRKQLDNTFLLFNHAIQRRLNPAPDGLPFPELEDLNQIKETNSQILILKRLSNSCYYLESAAKQLEKMNDKSIKPVYIWHFIQLCSDLIKTKDLLTEISIDPYLLTLIKGCIEQIHTACNILNERTLPYRPTTPPNLINQKGLFYAINTLTFLPLHVHSSKTGTLSQTDWYEQQTNANHMAKKLESIINKSDSSFKLIFEVPAMYSLFKKLKQTLLQFTTLSHKQVVENLRFINEDLITKILLEVDRIEDKLHLKPGIFSNQLEQILGEFYTGLLEPLKLSSTQHIALLTSRRPIEKRLAAAHNRLMEVKACEPKNSENLLQKETAKEQINYLKHIKANHANKKKDIIYRYAEKLFNAQLNTLNLPLISQPNYPIRFNLNREYHQKLKNHLNLFREDIITQVIKSSITPIDQGILYRLNKEKELFDTDYAASYSQLDAIIAAINTFEIYAYESKKLVKGNAFSFENLQTLEKKSKYLAQLRAIVFKKEDGVGERLIQIKKFVQDPDFLAVMLEHHHYVRFNFNKLLELILNLLIKIRLYSPESNKRYLGLLKATQAPPSNIITNQLGIFKTTQSKIEQNLSEEQYTAAPNQLNPIINAVNAFENYLYESTKRMNEHTFSFENTKTLEKKTEYLAQLRTILYKEDDKVEDRLGKIKEFIHHPIFLAVMLEHNHYDQFSFNKLIELVLNLFIAIGLYTPKSDQRYQQLMESTYISPAKLIDQPKITTNRLGLFKITKAQTENISSYKPTLIGP